MADLKQNVEVDGVWFGPDYPDNKPTAEQSKRIGAHASADRRPQFGDPDFEFGSDANEEPVAYALIPDKDAPAAKTSAPPKPDDKK